MLFQGAFIMANHNVPSTQMEKKSNAIITDHYNNHSRLLIPVLESCS